MAIEKIAVIGSGSMGHGIAQMAAVSGQEVSMIDVSDDILAKAKNRIRESLNRLADKGRIREAPSAVLDRITTTTSLGAGVSDADFVIEAVFEDIELKKQIISEVDAHAPSHTILATNTTGLSVTMIAEATKRKGKVIGTHWMNPPQLMKLVEVIKSKYTDDETIQSTLELCKRYDKEIVLVQKDVWLFLATRAHSGWTTEASLMYLRKEAGVKELDAVARYKVGLPMGPFELLDFTGGVDIRTGSFESAERILRTHPGFEPWPALLNANRQVVNELWRPMSENGLSGVKTGKGFFSYTGGKYVKPEIPREMSESVEPIQLLAPTINVSAWCVSHGVGTIDDVNKSFKLGYGWPKGIFEFVDDYGVDAIVNVLNAKKEKAPTGLKAFYEVSPLLARWHS